MKKRNKYLAIDVGTSSIKVGIIDENFNIIAKNRVINNYINSNLDSVEMDFNLLFNKVIDSLEPLKDFLKGINGVGFSVLCPGLVPLSRDGNTLYNAIIHLDRRSYKKAKWALEQVGEEKFSSISGNLPFPGGISLTSMLWFKKNRPEIYKNTYKLGHTNTFLAEKFTGKFGIDPTNASFTGLYNTVSCSGWSTEIIKELKLDKDKLPEIIPSYKKVGTIKREISNITNITQGTPVIMGVGDTACAALGAGVINSGSILNSTGTVEAIVLCLDRPYYDKKLLLRTHAIPNKWLIMDIIGAGGISLEWFRSQFCKEMEVDVFYNEYIPDTINKRNSNKSRLVFRPYLAGDRLSFSQKRASFSNLTLNATREDFLRALVFGILSPMKKSIKKFSEIAPISKNIYYTGKGSTSLFDAKKEFFVPYVIKPTDPDITLIGVVKLITMNRSDKYFAN